MVTRRFRALLGRKSETPASAGDPRLLPTLSDDERRILDATRGHTMTDDARVVALIDTVRYCVESSVPGPFVECGVWRGGSVLAMIRTLQELGVDDRDIYLFDTFEGMPEPSELDRSPFAPPARETWSEAQGGSGPAWPEFFDPALFNEQAVRDLLLATGYPEQRLHFVRGMVEETIPGGAPPEIALLRLDTDWYESTRHELEHLYPRLVSRGVLIIDDYGHWEGARRATDEYFAAHGNILLARIDYSARLAVKP